MDDFLFCMRQLLFNFANVVELSTSMSYAITRKKQIYLPQMRLNNIFRGIFLSCQFESLKYSETAKNVHVLEPINRWFPDNPTSSSHIGFPPFKQQSRKTADERKRKTFLLSFLFSVIFNLRKSLSLLCSVGGIDENETWKKDLLNRPKRIEQTY